MKDNDDNNNYNINNNDYNYDIDNDFPLTDLDEEGVIYEPSNTNPEDAPKDSPKDSPKKSSKEPTKYKKVKTSNISKITTLLILGGVLLSVTIFFTVYNLIGNTKTKTSQAISESPNAIELSKDLINQDNKVNNTESKESENNLAFINELDIESKKISLISLKDSKSYNLKIASNAEIKDKFNQSLSLYEFSIGDIVNFDYSKDLNSISSIRKNGEAWEHKSITNVFYDEKLNNINFGDYYYLLDPFTKVTKFTEVVPISELNPLDIITIKGYKNKVYSINIEKGHGTIQITNKESITNGIIKVDTNIYKKLSEVVYLDVSEGAHKIIIKGDNSNTFIKDIFVADGENVEIDLSDVEIKTGILLINSDVSDYFLYINNELELSREPLSLPYGAYSVKVVKPGYSDFQSQIVINKPQTSLNVKLNPLSSSQTNTSNNNTESSSSSQQSSNSSDTGKLVITSSPEGASVYIDGAYAGDTPLTYKGKLGTYKVDIKKDGYKEITLNSVEIQDKTNEFNITLQQTTSTTDPIIQE